MAKKKRTTLAAPPVKSQAASRQAERQQRVQKNRKRAVRRSNKSWWIVGGVIAVCVIVVGIFIYISDNQPAAGVVGSTDSAVLKTVTTVSPSVMDDVKTGQLQNPFTAISNQAPLTGPDGKPEIFYYGAEFCPYCAANRWSMVIALSRFGTFSQLPETLSSSSDSYPNTATFSFVNSQYTSNYVDFSPLEAEDRTQQPLQTPSSAQQQLIQQFNVQGFPFVDVGNQFQAGQFYDPGILANLSQKEIAAKLSNSSDAVTQNVVGAANYFTAAICIATHNQPANVCTDSTITAIIQSMPQGQGNAVPINNTPPYAVVENRRSALA